MDIRIVVDNEDPAVDPAHSNTPYTERQSTPSERKLFRENNLSATKLGAVLQWDVLNIITGPPIFYQALSPTGIALYQG